MSSHDYLISRGAPASAAECPFNSPFTAEWKDGVLRDRYGHVMGICHPVPRSEVNHVDTARRT
jgi:hypothetical protein